MHQLKLKSVKGENIKIINKPVDYCSLYVVSNLHPGTPNQMNIIKDIKLENNIYNDVYSNKLTSGDNVDSCEIIVIPPDTINDSSNSLSSFLNTNKKILNEFSKENNSYTVDSRSNFTRKFWRCIICLKIFLSPDTFYLHIKCHNFKELCRAIVSLTKPKSISIMSNIKQSYPACSPSVKDLKTDITTVTNEVSGTIQHISDHSDYVSEIIEHVNDSSYDISENVPHTQTESEHVDDLSGSIQYLDSELTAEIGTECSQTGSKGIAKILRDGNGYKHLKSRDPHRCFICKKILVSRGNLAKHMIIHQHEKPFSCKVCNIGFNAKKTEQNHYENVHANLPPSKCQICSKYYPTPTSLKGHMLIHVPNQKRQCDKCQKWFACLKALKQHKVRHANTMIFPCSFCVKKFKVKKNYVMHTLRAHSTLTR